MSFKEGQKVELFTFGTPVDGKDPKIRGRVTKLTHGHAIVCFESMSEGVRLAVKPTGQLVVLGVKAKLEPEWTQINVGDIEAVPLSDLHVADRVEQKPIPEWISREHAKHLMDCSRPNLGDSLDGYIENGFIEQSIEGLLKSSRVLFLCASLPTYYDNWDREQLRTAEAQAKAQEARKYVEKIGQLSH